jgi:hypothetical protein
MARAQANKREPGVSRSTLEAYAGLFISLVQVVVPMNFLFKALAIIVITFLIADIVWRHENLSALSKRAKLPIIALCAVPLWLYAAPELFREYNRDFWFEKLPAPYVKNYGGTLGSTINTLTHTITGPQTSFIVVDGTRLQNLAARGMVFKGVAMLHSNPVDPLDESNVSSSGPYEIANGDVQIDIPWNDYIENMYKNGRFGTNYYLLALPRAAANRPFSSIRQAVQMGAIIIQNSGGPP